MDAAKLAYVHEGMRYLVSDGESYVVPEKSYKNQSYMASHEAKPLRILAEFLEPEQRFRACGVDRTILFFGSARARSHADHAAAVARAEAAAADPAAPAEERRRQAAALDRLRRSAWMCDVYEDVAALARRLTEWSMGRIATGVSDGVAGGEGGDGGAGAAARPHGVSSWPPNYVVCTGGGPGLMEAANRGAAEVPGAITAGVAISLPFEAGLNKYVTPELAFTQHYFFSRKHALCYPARALVACPGGFGTADELFEVLTLLQSGKIENADTMPVVLFGGQYWRDTINWAKMLEFGVISQSDIDRLFFADSVDAAFDHVVKHLQLWEAAATAQATKAAAKANTQAVSAAAAAHAAALAAAAEATAHVHARSLVRPNSKGAPELLPPIKPTAEQVEAATRPVLLTPGV